MLLKPSRCEVDDFVPGFATSALNLARPFDPQPEPTHCIFVEAIVIDALQDLHSDGSAIRRARRLWSEATLGEHGGAAGPVPATISDEGGLLARRHVERLVGLKKSTIYQRIKEGGFPAPVQNGERLSSWRESDIRAWLKDPQ